jgi:hypothetical protein
MTDGALDHPRRQELLAYVLRHEGVGARDAAKATGIPASTVNHHLWMLKRHGLLAHTRDRSRLLFHAPNQRPTPPLPPGMEPLQEWLAVHPGRPQKAALDAMQASHGWPRSTTQHRLRLLVQAGRLEATKAGRTCHYRLVPSADPGHFPSHGPLGPIHGIECPTNLSADAPAAVGTFGNTS